MPVAGLIFEPVKIQTETLPLRNVANSGSHGLRDLSAADLMDKARQLRRGVSADVPETLHFGKFEPTWPCTIFRELTLDATELRFVSDTSDEPKRRNAMFTRVVAVRTKPGKVKELSKTIHDKILPILEDQPGFVDEILLVSNSEPDQILALSFWKSQQDAERYTHEEYPRINELISHLVESPPVSRTFDVDIFTSHKITRGKAA